VIDVESVEERHCCELKHYIRVVSGIYDRMVMKLRISIKILRSNTLSPSSDNMQVAAETVKHLGNSDIISQSEYGIVCVMDV
jgi:hypothetical protein